MQVKNLRVESCEGEKRNVKTRTQIVMAGVVEIGLAAVSSVNRHGGGPETRKCSGGLCCPILLGFNVWSTNAWAGTNPVGTDSVVAGSEATPKQQPQ
jgi:hypothetical protein